jgi:hypothetical protein
MTEKIIAYLQGKGFGFAVMSLYKKFYCVAKFLRNMPKLMIDIGANIEIILNCLGRNTPKLKYMFYSHL